MTCGYSERQAVLGESWITPSLAEIQALKRSSLWGALSERERNMYNSLERGKLSSGIEKPLFPLVLDAVEPPPRRLGSAYRAYE